MKVLSSVAIATCISVAMGTVALAESWDMPTPYPDGNFHTETVRSFAAELADATGITINVHSNGSLIAAPEIKRAVQTGQVQIGEILLSSLANENAIFGFDSVPGLAPSFEATNTLWVAARDAVTEALAEQNLVLLYGVAWPPQGIYSKGPIERLFDLNGQRFRSYNPATARFAELIGASPVTVQAAEIAQAFRTGVVDAMITSGATGVDTQAWDYLDYYYDLQAFLPLNIVFINADTYNGLSDEQRAALHEAAARAEESGWAMAETLNDNYKQTMADNGIEVLAATEAMSEELVSIAQTMTGEWLERAGQQGGEILSAYGF